MQPAMRDTTWNSNIQTMIFPDGTPKERSQWKNIRRGIVEQSCLANLEEREVNESSTIEGKIKVFHRFSKSKTLLEDLIESRGHLWFFYPKYHCEMSPIELV